CHGNGQPHALKHSGLSIASCLVRFAVKHSHFKCVAAPQGLFLRASARYMWGRSPHHRRLSAMAKPRTLYDKIWDDHLVDAAPDGTCLIYIDRHLVHEVTSPQAFEGLRLAGRKVHAPDKTLLVVDHNVPTTDRTKPNPDPESAAQIAYLAENAKYFGLEYFN